MAHVSLCFLLPLLFSAAVVTSSRPKSLILPVTKGPSTRQYTTIVHQRTPLVPVKLAVDLVGESLCVDCEEGYASSSFRSVNCPSAHCSLAGTIGCGDNCASPEPGPWYCNKKACYTLPVN